MLVQMTKRKNRDHHENRKVPHYYLKSVWTTAMAMLLLGAKVCCLLISLHVVVWL